MTVDVQGARESPLAGFAAAFAAASGPELTLREVPFQTQLNLRVDPRDEPTLAAVQAALGIRPPVEPNTVATHGERRVLWLGPDEWLVVAPDGDRAGLADALRAAVDIEHGSVVDVSANRTTIAIAGAQAADLLAAGCAVDLHPRAFGPGRCAQTLLAKAAIILEQRDDTPRFEVLVRPSFAAYLASWLLDAWDVARSATRSSRGVPVG